MGRWETVEGYDNVECSSPSTTGSTFGPSSLLLLHHELGLHILVFHLAARKCGKEFLQSEIHFVVFERPAQVLITDT